MFFNLIKFSLRHHAKHGVHAFINVFGLALGITCFVLLALLVQGEQSYDKYHKNKELIYQVYSPLSKTSGMQYADQLLAPVGPLFVNEIPEITEYVRFGFSEKIAARANDQRLIIDKLYYTDPNAFDFFSLTFITSDQSKVFLGLEDIVISESVAIRLFGSVKEALGQSLDLIDLKKLVIRAVFEDVPENSHLTFDYLIAFDHIGDFKQKIYDTDWSFMDWRSGGYPTYIKLASPPEELAGLEEKLNQALLPHRGERHVTLIPIDEIYFSDWNRSYFKAAGDDSYLNLYIAIALIILVVAIVNYTNLSTASFVKRAKEVGIRKAIGGQRSQLVQQFLVETFILVFIAAVLALCLFELSVPFFNSYTGKAIGIDYTSASTYLLFISFVLGIGLVAGVYPAFFLSAFSPKHGMKVSMQGQGRGVFRKLLVSFQFMACLSLMVITSIIFKQHKHLSRLDPGFEQELVVGVPLKDKNLQQSYNSFKGELIKNVHVTDVAGASFSLFQEENIIETSNENSERLMISWVSVENNFFDVLQIDLKEGQLLSDITGLQKGRGLIVNEATVEAAAWEKPLGHELIDAKIKGVVKDFIFGSAKEEITPLMFNEGEVGEFSYAYIALKGNIASALQGIENVFEDFSSDYVFEYQFLDDQLAAKYESEKRLGEAFAVFSVITLLIAGLGVLGLSVFIAQTRTKEIGIRKVMGAGTERIIWLLNGNITLLILAVGTVCLPLVYYFMNAWLQGFAFRASLSLSNFLLPLFILLAAVWSILFYHSLKSAKLNPVEALRAE